MPQFQVYADYGANYELVSRDIEETQQNMTNWSDFDRAIEVLSATVNPVRTREENRKKALTVRDLLIKVSEHTIMFMKTRAYLVILSRSNVYQDMSFCSTIYAN